MLSCKDITENADKYLEKDLPFFARLKVKMHLKMCIHCQRYVEQLQTTIQLLGKMKQPFHTDDGTVNNIVKIIKNSEKNNR